uniref:Conserved oligomeric Golgi complex subunit 5 n=1 Tax=Palpitomonas bilix TaxID=652834 RepID=A0A7S3G2R3_9EUKA|mmetsp:Transcript_20551/g.52798  ORF Transcript_20551/g.52798 Transcript_20551/m.52798 type:complete len:796 (+) Transcript_20551:143-2530(+)
MAATVTPRAIFEELELEAEFYEQFFDENFDATTIDASHVDSTVQRLRFGISQIEEAINAEVADKHSILLETALGARDLSKLVIGLESAAREVQASIQKIRRQFLDRYDSFGKKLQEQERLQSVLKLLRKTYRFLDLVGKLKRSQQNGYRDLAKAAAFVAELEECLADPHLVEVDIVKREIAFVTTAGQTIRSSASDHLQKALNSYSVADVGACAQVFANLSALSNKVENVIASMCETLRTRLSACVIYANGKGENKPPSVWKEMEDALDAVASSVDKIALLRKALDERKDASTQQPLIHTLSSSLHDANRSLVESGWESICTMCASVFSDAINSQKKTYAVEVIVGEYPRFASLLRRIFVRVSNNTSGAVRKQIHQDMLLKSAEPVLIGFLSKSFAKISETVNTMFVSRSRPPTDTEVESFLSLLRREAEASYVEATVCQRFLTQIGRSLQLFVQRALQELVSSPEAYQITGQANATQAHNAGLYNAVVGVLKKGESSLLAALQKAGDEFKERATKSTVPEDASEYFRISDALHAGVTSLHSLLLQQEDVLNDMLEPLFSAALFKIEQTIAGVHTAINEGRQSGSAAKRAMSPYVKDLRRQVTFLSDYILRNYYTSPSLLSYKKKAGRRVVELFVLHTCFCRVEGEDFSFTIAGDIPQVKLAAVTLAGEEKVIEREMEQLKEINTLFFTPVAEVEKEVAKFDAIPHRYVVHHLLCRGPSSFLLPFKLSDFTLPSPPSGVTPAIAHTLTYGRWLEKVDDMAAFKWIQKSMEAFKKLPDASKTADLLALIASLCERF